jgi:hypothetical protein
MFTNQNSASNGCSNIFSGVVSLGIAFVAGWSVYQSPNAGFWSAVLWLCLCTTALLGFIPIAGPFIYWKIACAYIIPSILHAAGLQGSWLTTLGLWLGLIASTLFSIASLYLCMAFIGAQNTTSKGTQLYYSSRYVCPVCGASGDELNFPDHICPNCHTWVVDLSTN